MDNPYLEEILLSNDDNRIWRSKEILIEKYSWAILTEEAIRKIVKYSPLIEIGLSDKSTWR